MFILLSKPIAETFNDPFRLGGLMASMIASSAEGVGSINSRGKPKTLKWVFAASPLSTHHLGVRSKTDLESELLSG